MGVTLERVQFKFASIIGELCSEPRVLSQFAVWLDLRLAEYKLRGSISLECSNNKPDPTWLCGIKEEKMPEKVLPYMLAASKGRRKPSRDTPYINSAVPRQSQPKTVVFPEISSENLTYQRLDARVHPASIPVCPDHLANSPSVTSQKVGFTEVPISSGGDNQLSGNISVKQEPKDSPAVFPVSMVSNERQSACATVSTALQSAPSTSRRKRQPSAIVRNTSSSGNFASPASSEEDPLSDSYFTSTPVKSPRISESAVTQSSSDSAINKDSDTAAVSKPDEFPVDSTTNSPMTIQTDPVLPPPGGSDSQISFSKGDNSTFTPPDDFSPYKVSLEQKYQQKYSRSDRGFFETPEQKKLRMRELAKMRQRRCRERQRIRRLLASDSISSLKSGQLHNDNTISLVANSITTTPQFLVRNSSCSSDVYASSDNGLAANFSVSE